MLAIVKTARSVRASLNYNEKKVERQQARLLDAHNFWQEKDRLSLREKVRRFDDLAVLNERSQKHAVHISLNFPTDDRLTDHQMTRIAADFMKGIDFAEQPWLVYRHIDAAHPHLHIVTTNIRPDGSRIKNDLRSPDHLKKVCFALEEKHALRPAIRMPDLFNAEQVPSKAARGTIALYGESPTKTEMTRVLDYVTSRYAFTTFESFNAILHSYRLQADRGREGTAMYQNRGLYYRMIDEDGKKIGAPIKASAFQLPVTIPCLEEKFRLNEARIAEAAKFIRDVVDWRIFQLDELCSFAIFRDELRRNAIELVIPDRMRTRQTPGAPAKADDGHDLFYISHDIKAGVRDTWLGEDYTAAAILRRTGIEQDIRRLAGENRLALTTAEQQILDRPREVDHAGTRRLLFRLSIRHDEIIENTLTRQEELRLGQQYGRGLSRGR